MANWRYDVLLEGDFSIPSRKRTVFKVTLIPGGLFYSPITNTNTQYEEKSVQMSDVIGCHCSVSAGLSPTRQQTNTVASFTVFFYPFRKKVFSGKKTRHRQVVTFEVDSCATLEENRKLTLRWANVINCLARGILVNCNEVETCEPPMFRQFLILVNPHSGPGRAMQIFKTEVEPMLEEASIPYKLIVTEYAGHAYDMVQNLDLDAWAAVVIVSGDGLIYEVINGLMQRVDWTSAIKKPIGCLPGGSGNALACSVNYAAGEPLLLNPVLHSTFVLIKHRVIPMDLVLVETPTRNFYSFLSVTWGIVADIDFESEKYRNLGEARFTLGALKRIVNLRSYSGRLSFLPVAEYTPKTAMAPKTLKKVRRFSLRSRSNSLGSMDSLDSRHSKSSSLVLTSVRPLGTTPPGGSSADRFRSVSMSVFANGGGDGNFTITEQSGSDTEAQAPNAQAVFNHSGKDLGAGGEGEGGHVDGSPAHLGADGAPRSSSAAVVDITSSTEINVGTPSNNNAELAHSVSVENKSAPASLHQGELSNGITPQPPPRTTVIGPSGLQKSASFVTTVRNGDYEEEIVYADKKDGEAVPTPFLPPLDQPVPDNWVVIEGKFVLACALYQTHLGSDMLAAPSARFGDGIIHLMFVREGISRNHLLNLFLTFSEGTHVDSPDVEFVPVLAFRLEPDLSCGNIMIDGERLDPTPVQGQVLPGIARIMAIQ